MSTEDTSTENTSTEDTITEKLRNITKDEMTAINNIAKKLIEKYELLGKHPKIKTVFSYNHYDDRFSSFKGDKNLIYNRSKALLNNMNYIDTYFDTYYEKHEKQAPISKDKFIEALTTFKERTTPKEVKEITTLTEQNTALTKHNEELTQQRDEAQQAFKDSKDIQHQKFADQSNNIKELQDKNDKLQDIIKSKDRLIEEYEKAPLKRNYINDKVFNESYSLDKDELINVILNDINKGKLPKDTNPEEIADAIYAKATKRIYKNLKRINNITALTGYNPDIYNKLPPEVAEIIKNHINDKIQEDIRKKNIRYILPKEKPRWEKAIQKYNLNPMLGRGAYTI